MKKKNLFSVLFFVALASVFIVSCQKEENKTINEPQTRTAVTRPFVMPVDIDGYLTDFKKQLCEPESGAPMGVAEAAWHLAALANYDFGCFNAEHNDILMDTLYGHVKITDGQVSFPDLAEAYSGIHETIDSYFQKLELDNKQIHFVNAFIGEDGNITIPVIVTCSDRHIFPYHNWYIDDTTYCQDYFYGEGPFLNFGNGMALLQYLLNLIESYNTDPNAGPTYAVPHDSVKPLPNNHLDTSSDPSPNYINSRIYITNGSHLENIPEFAMCYYLQSYHELGLSYLYNQTLLGDVITSWHIVEDTLHCDPHQPCPESINPQDVFYHQLTISYGFVATHGGGYDK